jgi:hypothetical protein
LGGGGTGDASYFFDLARKYSFFNIGEKYALLILVKKYALIILEKRRYKCGIGTRQLDTAAESRAEQPARRIPAGSREWRLSQRELSREQERAHFQRR